MKKNLIITIASLCIAAGLAGGLIVHGISEKDTNPSVETEVEVESESEMVCYYGCPNSRRIQKLNLKKKKMNPSG